jgi:hypothetical protein
MRVLLLPLTLSTLVVATGCQERKPATAALDLDYIERELAIALAADRRAQEIRFDDGPEPVPVATRPLAAAPRPQPTPAPRPQPAPAPRAQPAPVYSPAPAPAPAQPRVVTTNNVKRDAAIGAGVGAAAGAVIHKPNRWKGAVVGAAIGGAAGAVVGATVDKNTSIVYDFR